MRKGRHLKTGYDLFSITHNIFLDTDLSQAGAPRGYTHFALKRISLPQTHIQKKNRPPKGQLTRFSPSVSFLSTLPTMTAQPKKAFGACCVKPKNLKLLATTYLQPLGQP